LQGVEREIRNVIGAIAKGRELESLVDKLKECAKRRNDLRAAIDRRLRIKEQRIDRRALETSSRDPEVQAHQAWRVMTPFADDHRYGVYGERRRRSPAQRQSRVQSIVGFAVAWDNILG
jgi:hypothetical protein